MRAFLGGSLVFGAVVGLLLNLAFRLGVRYPEPRTWDRIERWVEAASDGGEGFGVADLLVAAIAADNGAALWSLDGDFRRMARLGFVELHPGP